MHRKYRQADLL